MKLAFIQIPFWCNIGINYSCWHDSRKRRYLRIRPTNPQISEIKEHEGSIHYVADVIYYVIISLDCLWISRRRLCSGRIKYDYLFFGCHSHQYEDNLWEKTWIFHHCNIKQPTAFKQIIKLEWNSFDYVSVLQCKQSGMFAVPTSLRRTVVMKTDTWDAWHLWQFPIMLFPLLVCDILHVLEPRENFLYFPPIGIHILNS